MNTLMKYMSLFLGGILVATASNAANPPYISGGNHFSLALKEDGTVWAWGEGHNGQLGDGTATSHLSPVQVSGLTAVISVSAGSWHSLAVKRDGTVWSWGRNDHGQLGDGTDEPRNAPVQVVGLSGVIAIDSHASGEYSLAVKNDGTVWAWGDNYFGHLGDGTTTDRWTPVQVIGLSGAIAVSAGGYSLVLKQDGTVWEWGGWYPLDDGTWTNRLTPTQVSNLTDVISIAAGSGTFLALKSDGIIWRWGLGDHSENYLHYDSIPVQQDGVSGVIDIQCGDSYYLVLTSYGTVWFWGSIDLDPNHNIWSGIPIPVDGISDVKAIAASGSDSGDHALAVKNDGTVWAWGANWAGALGDGTTHYRRSPVQVQGFSIGGPATVPSSVLAADFDEDGKADPTAVNSSGELFYWNSSQSFSRDGPIELGTAGQTAIGDVNADGQSDLAVVQAANWYFFLSSSNGYSLHTETFGQTGTPLLADFDGDRKADPTIVNSSGTWFVWLSGDGYTQASAPFAVSGATPVAADFDADGRADPVMVTSSGDWYLWPSSELYTQHGPYNFGVSGLSAVADKPVAGDFDGDGKADPGMVDSTGNWNLFLSARFYTRSGPWYLVLP